MAKTTRRKSTTSRRTSNDTQRNRLAKTLAAAEGIGYQAAGWRLDSAAREGALPARLDETGMAEALTILRERGRSGTARLEEGLTEVSRRSLQRRAPTLVEPAMTAQQKQLKAVELLVLSFVEAGSPVAFEGLVTDIGELPTLERAELAYLGLGVTFAVTAGYRPARDWGGQEHARALNEVMDAALLRCPQDIRTAFRVAWDNEWRPRHLTGSPMRDFPTAQRAYLLAGAEVGALGYVIAACDFHVVMGDAWDTDVLGSADDSPVPAAWRWLELNAVFAAAVVAEMAERTQRDPLQLLDEALRWTYSNLPINPRHSMYGREIRDVPLDYSLGALDAVEILDLAADSGRSPLDRSASAAFEPLFDAIDADPVDWLRRAGLLYALEIVAFATAKQLEKPYGPGALDRAQSRMDRLAGEVVTAWVQMGHDPPGSELDLLSEDGWNAISLLAAADRPNWRVTARMLAAAAHIGLGQLTEQGRDPEVVLEMFRQEQAPEWWPGPRSRPRR